MPDPPAKWIDVHKLSEELRAMHARAEKAEADLAEMTECRNNAKRYRDTWKARAEKAEVIITSVQAELLAGGSLVRLRAIVGLTPKEISTNERS